MNFTDFLYDVFILKSYETKSCVERNRDGRGEKGRNWVTGLALTKLKWLKENAPQEGTLSRSRSLKLQYKSTSAESDSCNKKNKWTRQTLSSLNQEYDEICHIIKGTRGPLLQRDDRKTAQSSFNEIQGARASIWISLNAFCVPFYWNLTV